MVIGHDTRIFEHISEKLKSEGPISLNSAIVRHLINKGYIIGVHKSLKIINK